MSPLSLVLRMPKRDASDSGTRIARDRAVRVIFDVIVEHFRVIHLVDMISRQNQNVIGIKLFDEVNILINRVGRSFEPVGRVFSLIRRKNMYAADARSRSHGCPLPM